MNTYLANPVRNGASGNWDIISSVSDGKMKIDIKASNTSVPNSDITTVSVKAYKTSSNPEVNTPFTFKEDSCSGKINANVWMKNNTSSVISFTTSGDPIKKDGSNTFNGIIVLNEALVSIIFSLLTSDGHIEVTVKSNDNKEWNWKYSLKSFLTSEPAPAPGKCTTHSGSLQFLEGVTCEEAKKIVAVSPPGQGQNYQPFVVEGIGIWATQDQDSPDDPYSDDPEMRKRGGQQPYRSQDGTKSFMWYSCERYPGDC